MNHLPTTKYRRCPHKASKRLCAVILCLLVLHKGNAQVSDSAWLRINTQHAAGRINDTDYFHKAEKLAEKSFKDPRLKEKLDLFKNIAWHKNKYQPYRYKYYAYLANNAAFTHKEGAAIYYIQKSEEELKKTAPYLNSLNEPRQLLAIYGSQEKANYEKRKEVFVRALPFLKRLPALISEKQVPANTCTNAMTILNHASRLYANLGDTGMVTAIQRISGKLYGAIQTKSDLLPGKRNQCLYLYYQIQFTASMMHKAYPQAKRFLEISYTLIRSDTTLPQVWARAVERALLRKYIDYFILQKQIDSCRHYMQLLTERIDKSDPGDGTSQLLYAAKVNVLGNHYPQAYRDLLRAYTLNDSVIALKTADINNNLYAQLLSEQEREKVIQLQKQTRKRNIMVALASFLALAIIATLVIQNRRKDKKAARKIDELHRLTQIEIAALEIKANLVQRKLGMELHNDIAGKLVYLCHTIDREIMDQTNEHDRKKMQAICDLARNTYQDTRNKSHEWYTEGVREEQVAFRESISKVTQYALPDDQFEKVIEIDDDSIQRLSYPVKVTLLRIIQESFVNILKHANAQKVHLSIYEQDQNIVAQIRDNGKGFDTNSTKPHGIGLLSLQSKVKDLGGTLDIQSAREGTVLIAAIPL